MNKKGTVIFWIIFVLIGSVGLFIVMGSKGFNTVSPLYGEWQHSFLENYVYRSAKDNLAINTKAQEILTQDTIDTSLQILSQMDLGCGKQNDIQKLNTKNKVCIPDITTTLQTQLAQDASKELNRKVDVQIKNNLILLTTPHPLTQDDVDSLPIARTQIGLPSYWQSLTTSRPSQKQSTAYLVSYSQPLITTLPLPPVVEELNTLTTHATQLLAQCKNDPELKDCIEKNRPERWQYGDCKNQPTLNTQQRTVLFCYNFFNSEKKYPFAIDFSSSQSTPIIVTSAIKQNAGYFITFPYNPSTQVYTLYYTNVESLKSYNGKSSDIIVLKDLNQHLEKEEITLTSTRDDCEAHLTARPHLCEGEIILLVEPSTPDTYFFALTQTIDSQESPIVGFIGSQ